MRRRAALFSVLALAAALVYAVQRDTAVRRWLVDPAARETATAASLGRVLPEVRLTHATLDQAAAELSRLGGVPVRVDPGVYVARMGDPGSVTLRLRNVRLGEAVLAAMAPAGGGPECCPMVVPRGGELVVTMPAEARHALVVRAHDVDDLLPPDGPPPPWSGGPFSGAAPLSDRQQAIEDLAGTVESDLENQPGSPVLSRWSAAPGTAAPCTRMFGTRMVVTVPAVDRARVPELLAAVRRGGRLQPRVTAE